MMTLIEALEVTTPDDLEDIRNSLRHCMRTTKTIVLRRRGDDVCMKFHVNVETVMPLVLAQQCTAKAKADSRRAQHEYTRRCERQHMHGMLSY